MSEDCEMIRIVGGSEMILKSVSILRKKTIEEGDEAESGVSVREKNGILGILLEVVEGGGWNGSYEELEEGVGRLEEEGEKEWRERRGKIREKGRGGGIEWKEMGRLARDVGWAIEERKATTNQGRGGDGSMITLRGLKKNLEDEKKKLEEKDKQLEEEKRKMEERIRSLEREVNEMKQSTEEMSPVLQSLSHFNLYISDPSNLTVQGNRITHVGGTPSESCVLKEILEHVCIITCYILLLLLLF